MKKLYLTTVLVSFFLLLGVQAEKLDTYSVVTRLAVLDDTKSGLNSDKKLKLQAIADGVAVRPVFFIASPDKVRILSKAQFDTKETISDVKTGQFSKEVKRVYHCAIVEVVSGPSAGKRGWTVVSRDTVDRFVDTYLSPDQVEEDESRQP